MGKFKNKQKEKSYFLKEVVTSEASIVVFIGLVFSSIYLCYTEMGTVQPPLRRPSPFLSLAAL